VEATFIGVAVFVRAGSCGLAMHPSSCSNPAEQ